MGTPAATAELNPPNQDAEQPEHAVARADLVRIVLVGLAAIAA